MTQQQPTMTKAWARTYSMADQLDSVAAKFTDATSVYTTRRGQYLDQWHQRQNSCGGGQYGRAKLQSGKKYRLRLINSAVDNFYYVSLDKHPLQPIASDSNPIEPIVVETLLVAIGQRYDVIIDATQTPGNYWFHAAVATPYGSRNGNWEGRSIFTYEGANFTEPTSTRYVPPQPCDDLPNLTPHWKQSVPREGFEASPGEMDIDIKEMSPTCNGDMVAAWTLGDVPLNIEWNNPTLQYVLNGSFTFPPRYNM
ncbi:multicopper oxidase [Piedraia hortae CBS 480.64]|uniref:laccase n=1 Tax=Piedraia hortae CBS 480.64 TaxID=1314780 RepID=A0A6A7BXX7_9PEZI|nr:multicopper oxidase [Piedraia hortae CBS 480.64]